MQLSAAAVRLPPVVCSASLIWLLLGSTGELYAVCPSFRIQVAYLHLAAAFRNSGEARGPNLGPQLAHISWPATQTSFDQR